MGKSRSGGTFPLPLRERLGEGPAASAAEKMLRSHAAGEFFAPQTRLYPSPGLSHRGRGARCLHHQRVDRALKDIGRRCVIDPFGAFGAADVGGDHRALDRLG